MSIEVNADLNPNVYVRGPERRAHPAVVPMERRNGAERRHDNVIPLQLHSGLNLESGIDSPDDIEHELGRLFQDKPEAAFFIGVIALGDQEQVPEAMTAYYRKRAEVYVDEMKFLSPEAKDSKGGESDEDDNRSIHIAAIARTGQSTAEIAGTSRLVIKHNTDDLLPVERLFPESFTEEPASVGSVEVSRYIARHESRNIQRMVSLGLIRTMVGYLIENDYGPAYAVVETPLSQLLDKVRLPHNVIGRPKQLDEYNSVNFPIVIDPYEVMSSIRPENHLQSSDYMRAFFDKTLVHAGVEYFDRTLTEKL